MLSAGRPLLVSLLLYLDDKWPRQWDAETLFLDDDTDIGIVVRPKRYRAVLMDQVTSTNMIEIRRLLLVCSQEGSMFLSENCFCAGLERKPKLARKVF